VNPDDKPTWVVYPNASDEPLDVIRRFWNEVERLRVALRAATQPCIDCGKVGGHRENEYCPARDESYF
jgi:hypothetical protein